MNIGSISGGMIGTGGLTSRISYLVLFYIYCLDVPARCNLAPRRRTHPLPKQKPITPVLVCFVRNSCASHVAVHFVWRECPDSDCLHYPVLNPPLRPDVEGWGSATITLIIRSMNNGWMSPRKHLKCIGMIKYQKPTLFIKQYHSYYTTLRDPARGYM